MNLFLQSDQLAICQLPPNAPVPDWAMGAVGFVSITRTSGELSIVCPAHLVPNSAQQEAGWRAFKVEGPLDFAQAGILASLAGPLAKAGISIFALSTYDMDYVLVRANQVDAATKALQAAGHAIQGD